MLLNHVKAQVGEIKADRRLALYGCALAFTHLLTSYFWRSSVPELLSDPYPSCWPFWKSCYTFHVFSASFLSATVAVYGALALLCVALFWRGAINAAYALLFFLTALKYAMLLGDYRLMGNYHYMPFLAIFAYLFVPGKTWTCRVLITLFYFSAGTLKLNREWLGGASVGRPLPYLNAAEFQACCAYVVFLELILIWGLWSRFRSLRWLTFAQLVLFHGTSWYWVGYFYPLNMAALDSIFILIWLSHDSRGARADFSEPAPRTFASYGFLAVYALMQVPPHVTNQDSALDGRLRILSLNMFDARSLCVPLIMLHYEDRIVEYVPNYPDAVRIHCDPILFESDARNLCRNQRGITGFQDLDLHVVARRTSETEYLPIVNEEGICHREFHDF